MVDLSRKLAPSFENEGNDHGRTFFSRFGQKSHTLDNIIWQYVNTISFSRFHSAIEFCASFQNKGRNLNFSFDCFVKGYDF